MRFVVFLLGLFFFSSKSVLAKTEAWGFLPYWRINSNPKVEAVDKLFFFSIPVEASGKLKWDFASKRIFSDTFKKQAETVKNKGGTVGVVYSMLKDKTLDKFLEDRDAWKVFFKEAKELEEKFGGTLFNIDFEYQKSPTAILRPEYFEFLRQAREKLSGELSVDVFGNTLIKGDEVALKKLFEVSDRVVFMAYDFYPKGYAGVNAPLAGMAGADLMDVFDRVEKLGITKVKMVTALPLYGYEWRTKTSQWGSELHPRAVRMLATIGRVEREIREKKLEVKYDEVTQSAWIVYKNNGQLRQIYYDNEKSLRVKIEAHNKKGFGAVAWWALGYEGEFGDKLQKLVE